MDKTTFAMLFPFSGRFTPPFWGLSLATLRWPSNSSHIILHSVRIKRDAARNLLVKRALKYNARYVVFVDDDCQIPSDTIYKLHMALETADTDVMACSGIYTSKCQPAEPYVYLERDGAPHWKWKMGEVFPCHSIGTGCMMIKAEVFEKIPEPWFRDIDSLEELGDDPHYKVSEHVGELRVTDDIYWSHKLHQAGFKMLAHGGVLPVHWGQDGTPYTLPQDSYPFQGIAEKPWYSAFEEVTTLAPKQKVVLPDGFLTIPEATELHNLARGKLVLEMGAYKGRSTVAMALSACHVTSVDWHGGDDHTRLVAGEHGSTLEEYMRNIEPYKNVTPIVGRFEDVLPSLAGNRYDVVFVDGFHSREAVTRDVKLALSFYPEVLVIHDWNLFEVNEGVREAGITEEPELTGTLAVFRFTRNPEYAAAA